LRAALDARSYGAGLRAPHARRTCAELPPPAAAVAWASHGAGCAAQYCLTCLRRRVLPEGAKARRLAGLCEQTAAMPSQRLCEAGGAAQRMRCAALA
jgi:hypothetical protein